MTFTILYSIMLHAFKLCGTSFYYSSILLDLSSENEAIYPSVPGAPVSSV